MSAFSFFTKFFDLIKSLRKNFLLNVVVYSFVLAVAVFFCWKLFEDYYKSDIVYYFSSALLNLSAISFMFFLIQKVLQCFTRVAGKYLKVICFYKSFLNKPVVKSKHLAKRGLLNILTALLVSIIIFLSIIFIFRDIYLIFHLIALLLCKIVLIACLLLLLKMFLRLMEKTIKVHFKVIPWCNLRLLKYLNCIYSICYFVLLIFAAIAAFYGLFGFLILD